MWPPYIQANEIHIKYLDFTSIYVEYYNIKCSSEPLSTVVTYDFTSILCFDLNLPHNKNTEKRALPFLLFFSTGSKLRGVWDQAVWNAIFNQRYIWSLIFFWKFVWAFNPICITSKHKNQYMWLGMSNTKMLSRRQQLPKILRNDVNSNVYIIHFFQLF